MLICRAKNAFQILHTCGPRIDAKNPFNREGSFCERTQLVLANAQISQTERDANIGPKLPDGLNRSPGRLSFIQSRYIFTQELSNLGKLALPIRQIELHNKRQQ